MANQVIWVRRKSVMCDARRTLTQTSHREPGQSSELIKVESQVVKRDSKSREELFTFHANRYYVVAVEDENVRVQPRTNTPARHARWPLTGPTLSLRGCRCRWTKTCASTTSCSESGTATTYPTHTVRPLVRTSPSTCLPPTPSRLSSVRI